MATWSFWGRLGNSNTGSIDVFFGPFAYACQDFAHEHIYFGVEGAHSADGLFHFAFSSNENPLQRYAERRDLVHLVLAAIASIVATLFLGAYFWSLIN